MTTTPLDLAWARARQAYVRALLRRALCPGACRSRPCDCAGRYQLATQLLVAMAELRDKASHDALVRCAMDGVNGAIAGFTRSLGRFARLAREMKAVIGRALRDASAGQHVGDALADAVADAERVEGELAEADDDKETT